MAMTMDAKPQGKLRKVVLSLVLGGLCGFAGAYGLLNFVEAGAFGEVGSSQEVALLIALIYFLTAASVLFGLLLPKAGAKVLNVEDADELVEQRAVLTWSCVGIFGIVGILVLAALCGPAGPVPRDLALAGVVLFAALTYGGTMRQMRFTDEMMLTVSRKTSVTAFNLLGVVGGGWSMLAIAEYVPAPQPLDWLSMMAGLLLVACFWVCGRAGLLTPR